MTLLPDYLEKQALQYRLDKARRLSIIQSLERPQLHPAQVAIKQDSARFKVVDCGRRFGKTILGTDWLSDGMVLSEPTAYAAPIYAQVEIAWRTIKQILKPIISYSNETKKRLELTTGGILDMWSLESPESIRGAAYKRIVIDEAAFIKGLLKIWEKTLSPLLTDLQGSALFLSTPQGYNDFFKLYQYGLEGGVEGWKSFKFPTSANPHIPPEEIELQRKTLPPRSYAQEYEASFEEDAGAVYDNFSVTEGGNVTSEADYNPDLPVAWWVDDGYVYGDGPGTATYHPRVILLAQYPGNGGVNVFAEYVACGELSEVTIANVLDMPYKTPEVAYIDSSAAELKSRLWGKNIPTMGATHKVDEGIKNVRRLVCDGQGVRLLRIHPRCTHTRDEMQRYRMDPHASPPKPLKIDDHCPDAIRYGCHVLRYE